MTNQSHRFALTAVTELVRMRRDKLESATGASIYLDAGRAQVVVSVPKTKPNRSFIFEPIKTVGQAMAFIALLQAHSIMWHFDDNVEDIEWGDTEFPPDATELVALNARVDDMVYNVPVEAWGEYEGPIGYALFVMKLMDQA